MRRWKRFALSFFRKRRAPRFPSLTRAKLTSTDGWLVEAYIKEISRHGARLSVAEPKAVPDEIYIEIPAERIAVAATVVWRSHSALGIEFQQPATISQRSRSDIDHIPGR